MARHRFEFLDGIRGIAALLVVTRHTPDYWGFSLFRSYLAVDVFFILSGFVIANAYDRRLQEKSLSFLQFVKIRVIRLYPVYFLSVLIASGVLIADLYDESSDGTVSLLEIGSTIALTFLLLPSQVGESIVLFPMNGPYWSLFFEVLTNLFYAVIRPSQKTRILLAVMGLCGVLVAAVVLAKGHLNRGFNWGAGSVLTGLARATFGVFLGLLIHRHFERIQKWVPKASPWLGVAIIVSVLVSPDFGRLNAAFDLLAVGILFPVCLIWAAMGSSERTSGVLLALGAASYPMYVLHEPVGKAIQLAFPGTATLYAPWSGIALVIALVFFSLWLERIYDIPVRQRLSTRRFS